MNARPETESPLPDIIGRMCSILSGEHFPSGERAALRRMQPDQPPPLYFYRFALRHLPTGWEKAEQDWITLVAGMALMAPHTCRRGYGLGWALGKADYSEARLERLLQSSGNTRRTLLLRAVRFLAAKGSPFDWQDATRFLLTRDPDKREDLNRHLASDFYRALDQQQKSTA